MVKIMAVAAGVRRLVTAYGHAAYPARGVVAFTLLEGSLPRLGKTLRVRPLSIIVLFASIILIVPVSTA